MLYPLLASHVSQLLREPPDHQRSNEAGREEHLTSLRQQLSESAVAKEQLDLLFVCTHNSRRSHLAQIWASLAAAYFGHDQLCAYSCGTEVTALNERAVAATEQLGFRVERPPGDNPRYQIYFSEDYPPVSCWSKRFDDPSLPQKDFTAIMVCDHAERNCPLIPGTKHRMSLPFVDPKYADGTAGEAEAYQTAALAIGGELLKAFSK